MSTHRLSGAESDELTRHVASLTRSGVPLGRGMGALALELPRGRLRTSFLDLAGSLEAGQSLESAIGAQSHRFPPHLRGLAIAGARTGRLGETLTKLSGYIGVGDEIKRSLKLRLAYPFLTLLATFSIFLFICLVVVEQFESIYRDFNIPLPLITVGLLEVARFVNLMLVPGLIMAGIAVGLWILGRLALSDPMRRRLAARLPVAGSLWRTITLAEYCHLLGLLLESKLSLPEALPLAAEGVRDADFDRAAQTMARDVAAGESLGRAMTQARLFPPGLPRLIHWAEQHMSLPEVLHMAGSMFEARARAQAAIVGAIAVGSCTLFVIFQLLVIPALFLPLITLISRLSG